MRRFGLGLCALLLASSLARAQTCKLGFAASLPLVQADGGNRLLIDVTLDRTPLRVLLDTGSESILLSTDAVHRASRAVGIGSLIGGSEEGDLGFASGVGGSTAANYFQIDDLGLGRMHGAFQAAMTADRALFTEDGAVGLLGMSVLGNFDVDFDLLGGALRLYSTRGRCDAPLVALDQPLYATPLAPGFHDQLRPLVRVVINGQGFTALLDTGAPGVLLFGDTAGRLGLRDGGGATTEIRIAGVGGTRRATASVLETLAVGPITLRHVPVAIDRENVHGVDLLLGLDFLRRVHVWLSLSSRMLVMQYPPAASPPLKSGAP